MATYTIKETAPIVIAFAKANIRRPLLSVLPYVLICGMITAITDKTHPYIGIAAQLMTFYFSSLYASNVHRSFLHGTPTTGLDPFRPSKDDWRFMGMVFLVFLIVALIGAVSGFLGAMAHSKSILITAILLSCIIAVWMSLRISLVFPDRAVGGHMKMRESFALTRGLVGKMLLTPFAASWILLLASIGWLIVAGLIDVFIIQKIFPAFATKEISPSHKLVLYVLMSPVTVGMSFWYSTVCVATLSNYYLWVKENRA
ncbi:MAG: putative rane protein [Micavibrio sp.]|nr:putative rane protein [Micavibrio sp.]